jgi:hypothetical protein
MTPENDPTVREETDAAAEEAGHIGGRGGAEEETDPAMKPVREAGGGEAEGFEAAEAELREGAEHADRRNDPARNAFPPEEESDKAGAEYGEADHVIEADEG